VLLDRALKATARAYAIQGLVKYHGLRNARLRIPFHDSISVCMKALPTITTVAFDRELREDRIRIDGKSPLRNEEDRVLAVVNHLRQLSNLGSLKARIESRNPDVKGKGLGFSSSGFAALGLATARALELNIKTPELSEVGRSVLHLVCEQEWPVLCRRASVG
jgi:phosphomevalonate decarboxylase